MCVPGMIAAMTSARSANVPHRPSAQELLEGLRTLGIVGTPTVVVCPLSSMCVNGCGRSSRITSRSNSFSSLTLFAHRHSCFVICVCVLPQPCARQPITSCRGGCALTCGEARNERPCVQARTHLAPAQKVPCSTSRTARRCCPIGLP